MKIIYFIFFYLNKHQILENNQIFFFYFFVENCNLRLIYWFYILEENKGHCNVKRNSFKYNNINNCRYNNKYI